MTSSLMATGSDMDMQVSRDSFSTRSRMPSISSPPALFLSLSARLMFSVSARRDVAHEYTPLRSDMLNSLTALCPACEQSFYHCHVEEYRCDLVQGETNEVEPYSSNGSPAAKVGVG